MGLSICAANALRGCQENPNPKTTEFNACCMGSCWRKLLCAHKGFIEPYREQPFA